MKKFLLFFFAFLISCIFIHCTTSSTSHRTYITYDTISKDPSDCSLISLYFTSGFDDDPLIITWNNTIIYNEKITSDKITGIAMESVSLPKNQGILKVDVGNLSIKKAIDTKYCKLVFSKSGDSLFLEFTNRKISWE